MFQVVGIQPQSKNGTGEMPTHYHVVGMNGKVIFGFPEHQTAQDFCNGLNREVTAAVAAEHAARTVPAEELVKLMAACQEALRVLDKIGGSNQVFESRMAANALWLALKSFNCV